MPSGGTLTEQQAGVLGLVSPSTPNSFTFSTTSTHHSHIDHQYVRSATSDAFPLSVKSVYISYSFVVITVDEFQNNFISLIYFSLCDGCHNKLVSLLIFLTILHPHNIIFFLKSSDYFISRLRCEPHEHCERALGLQGVRTVKLLTIMGEIY